MSNPFPVYIIANDKTEKADYIYFECVQSEETDHDGEITEHPVEVGANIADHFRPELDVVNLTVFVSQNIVDPKLSNRTQQTAVLDGKPQQSVTIYQLLSPIDFVGQLETQLENYRRAGTLFTIVRPSRTLEKMLLKSINVSGDESTGTGRVFELQFRQIIQVQTRLVAAPVPTTPRGQNKVSKGSQETTPVKESVAANLHDKVGSVAAFITGKF